MRYLSLDLETTSINSETGQILEIGIVAVDTNQKPGNWKTFHCIVEHEEIHGDNVAIAMNARIFDFIKRYNKDPENIVENWNLLKPGEVYGEILAFLNSSGYKKKDGYYNVTVAGKNVATFDLLFLRSHFNRYNHEWQNSLRFHKRTIDPTILFTDFVNDHELPSLEECNRRAKLPAEVTHNALEDAWAVVYLICGKIGFDFFDTITPDKLDLLFIKEVRSIRTYWKVQDDLIVRCITDATDYNMPTDKFHTFEIGNPIDNNWEYIWNMKDIINIK